MSLIVFRNLNVMCCILIMFRIFDFINVMFVTKYFVFFLFHLTMSFNVMPMFKFLFMFVHICLCQIGVVFRFHLCFKNHSYCNIVHIISYLISC